MGAVILGISAITLLPLLRPMHQPAATAGTASTGSSLVSPAASSRASSAGAARGGRPNLQPILRRLQADVAAVVGSYGVAVVDLASGTSYGLEADRVLRAASLNKLPILITLYQQATTGGLDLDDTITIQDDDIQHYGTGLIQDPESPRIYSLRELGALMIETSDNTAAYVLTQRLGEQTIQHNLDAWGLTKTSMADNLTSPADTAALLSRLYRRELLSPQATEVVLTLLTHTVFTDRLQSGVPDGIPVAHKVGTDQGIFNDAALVLDARRPFAIVVMTANAPEDDAQATMTRVARDVYAFESGLPVRATN